MRTFIISVAAVSAFAFLAGIPRNAHAIDASSVAQCLSERKFTMHGKKTCSACAMQKAYFGSSFSLVPYVECDSNAALCDQKNIHAYPTWEDASGKQYKGAMPLDKLWELAQCAQPTVSAPPASPAASLAQEPTPDAMPTGTELFPLIQLTAPSQTFSDITREQVFAAFFAGLLSFFAPCLLPLYPAYFSVITGFTFTQMYGLDMKNLRKRILFSSVSFVSGFTIIFILLGATGSLVGHLLEQYLPYLLRISGILLICLGLIQTGVLHIPSLTFDYAWNVQRRLRRLGMTTAVLTGSAAAFSWIPCVGPLLGSILLLSAQSNSILEGSTLLFIYSMGLTLPFILSGLYFPVVIDMYRDQRLLLHRISVAAGIFLIAFGFLLLIGQYRLYTGWFSGWIASLGQLSPDWNVVE